MNLFRKLIEHWGWFWIIFFCYFFYLMLNITQRYIPFHSDIAFLQIKQKEVHSIPGYLTFFYLHVYSSIFALLAGFTQFNHTIQEKYPKIHKRMGILYVYVVLFLSAPSGIFIGFYANGGLTAKISFIILGILWFAFTIKGILLIRTKNINLHRNFMLRSFALAVSAITLRLWKVVLIFAFEPNPMDVYKIIAWLGWIPNLLLIEWYIYKKNIK